MTTTISIFAIIIFITSMSSPSYHRLKADRDSAKKSHRKMKLRPSFLLYAIGGLLLWFSIVGYLIYPPLLAWSLGRDLSPSCLS